MKRNFLASAALLTAIALAGTFAASPAQAGLELELQSGGSSYTQSGGSPLVVVHSIGNFSTTVNTGTATTTPSLDLSSVDITSSGGGTLVIIFSGNDFSKAGATAWLSQFSGNFVYGTATVTLQTYLDNTDTLLGTATLLNTLSASTTPFALSSMSNALATTPFALTEVLTIVTTGAAEFSLDGSVTDVPEPASLTLLGTAMVGVGALARRKRNV